MSTPLTPFGAAVYSPVSPIVAANAGFGSTIIVVFGASGDLAKKKTYPSIFGLFLQGHLNLYHDGNGTNRGDGGVIILGYARSELKREELHDRLRPSLLSHPSLKGISSGEEREKLVDSFLQRCDYMSGSYESGVSFQKLRLAIEDAEVKALGTLSASNFRRLRMFYLALPPSVFISVSEGIKKDIMNETKSPAVSHRVVIEKPFGKDTESAALLLSSLASLFQESEMFRIDHYLGKEMVKNILVLRFANTLFCNSWNRDSILNVQITFKEKIGTAGRGGYFDEFGIIRDVMQNHLLQILALVAMEMPKSLDAEHVRDAKVAVLKQIPPLTLDKVILGQYIENVELKEPGYLQDKTVPPGSLTPTYAAAVFYVNNERWKGVPFILKCGKAVNEQKAEIRIQYKDIEGGSIFKEKSRNELVIRVQPDESVYLKMLVKKPGLATQCVVSELDLSYAKRYREIRIPDAYESLLLDVLRDDRSNFVRDDELIAAWEIFTPLLHQLEREKIKPEPYIFGSRGPTSIDTFIERFGYKRSEEYRWEKL